MSIQRKSWAVAIAGTAIVGVVAISPVALAGSRGHHHHAAASPRPVKAVSASTNSARVVALVHRNGKVAKRGYHYGGYDSHGHVRPEGHHSGGGNSGGGNTGGGNSGGGNSGGGSNGGGNTGGGSNGGGNTGGGNNGGGSNGGGNNGGGNNGGGLGQGGFCHYPPSRAPQVGLTTLRVGPDHVHLTGTAKVNDCPQRTHPMGLYHSLDGVNDWHLEEIVNTDSSGAGGFRVGLKPGGYYKLLVAGDSDFLPGASAAVRVG